MSTTGPSGPTAKRRAFNELPQPLYLFELLTRSRHYHFGYFVDGPAESVASAMSRLSRECMLHLAEGSRVLDVGCALGGTSMALGAAGFDVVAIDPCASAIAYAQEARGRNGDRVRFQRIDLESYARDRAVPGSFGGILMIEVLQHFPRLAEALRWCRRLLARGGTLVVSDIAKLPDLRWSRVPFHRRDQLLGAAAEAELEVAEHRDVTAHVSATMSRMAGLARAWSGRLSKRLAASRPSVQQELDELLLQLQHLDAGFNNGDLTYDLTVLRRR